MQEQSPSLEPESILAEAGMRQWLVDNACEKRVAHSHTLEQFGLSGEGIRRDFASYRERLIIPAR